jgi:hypothetical protein
MGEIASEMKNQQFPLKKMNEPQNGVKEGSPGKGSPVRGNASLGKEDLAGIADEKFAFDNKVTISMIDPISFRKTMEL